MKSAFEREEFLVLEVGLRFMFGFHLIDVLLTFLGGILCNKLNTYIDSLLKTCKCLIKTSAKNNMIEDQYKLVQIKSK